MNLIKKITENHELKELMKEVSTQLENIPEDDTYHCLKSNYVTSKISKCIEEKDLEKLHFYFDNAIKIDKTKPIIPKELGNYLEQLEDNKDFYLGIYQSVKFMDARESDFLEDENLISIFTNGIESKTFSKRTRSLLEQQSKVTFPTKNLINLLLKIKTSYKGKVSIIMSIPAKMLDDNLKLKEEMIDYIYDTENETATLKPEFFLGYIIQDNGVCYYHSKDEVLSHQKRKKLVKKI